MVYVFENQKSHFKYILEGLKTEKCCYIFCPFGIFFDHLVYNTAVWYISSHFGMLVLEKSGNPEFVGKSLASNFRGNFCKADL
jgi:hypothetical protein